MLSTSTGQSKRALSSFHVPREGILMIISPAKTFDLTPINDIIEPSDYLIYTQPDCCIEQTIAISRSMKRMSKTELAKVLKLSPALANVTKEYWSDFEIEVMNDLSLKQPKRSKPCLFMYSGAAYQGISIRECDVHSILYMQDNLRILDAVYGVLRPLDQIQPYRLEMDTKGIVLPNTDDPIPKLSTYWSDAITKQLAKDLHQTPSTANKNNTPNDGSQLPILLNLASEEYTAAIDAEQMTRHCRFIKVIFYENFKIISVHAKRARGLMVRYLSEINATTLEEVQQFNIEGYQYVPEKSSENTLVFNCPTNSAKQPTATKAATTRKKLDHSLEGTTNKRSKQRY